MVKINSKGFTLIELLVVVAIIAVLISILLPSLSKARDMARSTVCASRTRALHQAWMMYCGDYGKVMPCFHGYSGDSWEKGCWLPLIKPYIGGYKVGAESLDEWMKNLACTEVNIWLSYNEKMDPFTSSIENMTPLLSYDAIPEPSRTVVFADSLWGECYTRLWGGSFTYSHSGKTKSNFGFADGHVESAVTRSKVDALPRDGILDPFPPKKFIYDPRSNQIGWPGWNYAVWNE
jgi:prepilin-type N-terminal cleavage/methylation domain-containing protein/prepilin-type processing-associated H-X9-DG protein